MKIQKLNRTLLGAMLISGALGVATQAHADLNLSPATPANWTSNIITNLSQTQVEGIVGVSPLGLAYKMDNNPVLESGNAGPYYTTSFIADPNNVAGDQSGATITWDGGLKISCGDCFLIVKDGNSVPVQYIFDISTWNGTDTINLSNFWLGKGGISNVAIWNNADGGGGGGGSLVPEPETYAMLLAGLGLVGFAARRKLS